MSLHPTTTLTLTARAGFKPGDLVVLAEIPPWVTRLPIDSQRVFHFCLDKEFLVVEITDAGHVILDVSKAVDQRFGGFMNDIRVEPCYLLRASQRR